MTQPQPTISDFSVITEDIETNALSMRASVDDVAGELAALRRFVVSTEEFWQGHDHRAFLELMTSFDQNANSLENALTAIAEGLKSNASNYTSTGAQNQTIMANLHDGLPPATF